MSKKPATETDLTDILVELGPCTWKEIADALRRKGRTLSEGDFAKGEISLNELVKDKIIKAEPRRISKKDRRELEKIYGSSGKRDKIPLVYSLTD